METLARILESILRTAAGWPDWIGSAAALLGALFFSLLLHALLFRVLQRWVNTDSGMAGSSLRHARRLPLSFVIPVRLLGQPEAKLLKAVYLSQ